MSGSKIAGVVLCALVFARWASAEMPGPNDRVLVVMLDAVPFEVVQDLAEEDGMFVGFEAPLPLISTFPSSTSVALPKIFESWALERSPGYEARFFDWKAGRRRGGGIFSYSRLPFPWRSFFDWNRKGAIRNALHGGRPIRAGIGELRNAVAAFAASDKKIFTVYIADTDTAAHLNGPSGVVPMLRALSQMIQDLEERSERPIWVVLLSDHGLAGGRPLKNVLPDLRRALRSADWRLKEKLQGARTVVLTPFGLVSNLEVYVNPVHAGAVSQVLVGVDGVDLCVRPSDSGWTVDSGTSAVRFSKRDSAAGIEWIWSRERGGSSQLVDFLESTAPANRWISDAALGVRTRDGAYPDPFVRLSGAFEAVQNPATIVCSLQPGFMFGSRATERLAKWTKGRLQWTHGALDGASSRGFIMKNFGTDSTAGSLRYDQALAWALDLPFGEGSGRNRHSAILPRSDQEPKQ